MVPYPKYDFAAEQNCREPWETTADGHRRLCPADTEFLADLAKIRRQAKNIAAEVVDWLER